MLKLEPGYVGGCLLEEDGWRYAVSGRQIDADGADIEGHFNRIEGDGCVVTGHFNWVLGDRCKVKGAMNVIDGWYVPGDVQVSVVEASESAAPDVGSGRKKKKKKQQTSSRPLKWKEIEKMMRMMEVRQLEVHCKTPSQIKST